MLVLPILSNVSKYSVEVRKLQLARQNQKCCIASLAYSDPCQISKMEVFVYLVKGFEPLITFAKNFLDAWIGSEYVSRWIITS